MAGDAIGMGMDMLSNFNIYGSLAKSALGLGQMLFSSEPERPEYKIPEAVSKSLGIYQSLAEQGLPGEDVYASRIGRSAATTLDSLAQMGTGAAINQASSVYNQQLDQMVNLAIASGQQRVANQQNLAQAYQTQAEWEDKAWQYNEMMPYQMKYNKYLQNQQAGQANLFGGMNDLMSGQMALGAAQQKKDMLGKLFGTGQATQPAAQQQVAPMQSKSASLIPNQQINLNPRNAEQLYFGSDTPNSSYGMPSYSSNVTGVKYEMSNPPFGALINLLFK